MPEADLGCQVDTEENGDNNQVHNASKDVSECGNKEIEDREIERNHSLIKVLPSKQATLHNFLTLQSPSHSPTITFTTPSIKQKALKPSNPSKSKLLKANNNNIITKYFTANKDRPKLSPSDSEQPNCHQSPPDNLHPDPDTESASVHVKPPDYEVKKN